MYRFGETNTAAAAEQSCHLNAHVLCPVVAFPVSANVIKFSWKIVSLFSVSIWAYVQHTVYQKLSTSVHLCRSYIKPKVEHFRQSMSIYRHRPTTPLICLLDIEIIESHLWCCLQTFCICFRGMSVICVSFGKIFSRWVDDYGKQKAGLPFDSKARDRDCCLNIWKKECSSVMHSTEYRLL